MSLLFKIFLWKTSTRSFCVISKKINYKKTIRLFLTLFKCSIVAQKSSWSCCRSHFKLDVACRIHHHKVWRQSTFILWQCGINHEYQCSIQSYSPIFQESHSFIWIIRDPQSWELKPSLEELEEQIVERYFREHMPKWYSFSKKTNSKFREGEQPSNTSNSNIEREQKKDK
jgi:hypothetical protein